MNQFLRSLLTDKSFWAAVVSLVTCICVALNVSSGSVEQIASFIGALGTLIAYIISNGIQAAAAVQAQARVEAAAKLAEKK